jgi:predicted O-linked N-acetylglucosamine transferase (SPINDLY family)
METPIEPTLKLAIQHHKAGHLAQAERLYRHILALNPNHPEALNLLGVIAQQVGNADTAIHLLNQAIAANPSAPDYHINLGVALYTVARFDDAVAAYRQALRLDPNNPVAHNNLGNALRQIGRPDEAITECREALRINPNYAEASNNLGNALQDKGLLDEATAAYRRAIQLNPRYSEAFSNLASSLKTAGDLNESIAAFQDSLRLNPGNSAVHSNLLNTLNLHPDYDAPQILDQCRAWAKQFETALLKSFGDSPRYPLPWYSGGGLGWGPEYQKARISVELFETPLTPPAQAYPNDQSPNRPLRIGYVSPDLYGKHPIGRILAPVLAAHDPHNVEVVCYSGVVGGDQTTARLTSSATLWRDVAAATNADLARQIREDRIDILVDLALHTIGNRLLVFARRPAPIQVTWLGYPGTTGLSSIQYRLTDPILDPPGSGDELYSEKSLRLPHSFWCYAPPVENEPVNSLPALEAGFITFGSLSSFAKVTKPTITLWIETLNAVPNSRLLILCPRGNHRQRFLKTFTSSGISPDRIELIDSAPLLQYMQNYHRVDFCLDTHPYPGHTTTCDALWMGVPTVTLRGQTAVARGGASILTNVGLTEWIADSPRQYVEIATAMTADPNRLARLRSESRDRLRNSSLMNWKQFAADLESAYRLMWQTWINHAH